MPIYLPPISRRRFLGQVLAGSAALAAQSGLLAAGKSTDSNSWAFLSDPHLAADRSLVVRGVNMTEHFKSVSRELLDLPQAPAGVFINGDCAYNTGETSDYAALADLLEPIRRGQMPVHLALGNHDHRERFWDAFQQEKATQRPVANRQTALLRSTHANWFVLDSLQKTAATPGVLGEAQLDWLAKALDANADRPALVMVHHNPGLQGNIGLIDTVAFLEIIRARRQVKAYIFGHTHDWKVTQDDSGIHLINLPPVGYVFTEGNPSGWVHAKLQADGLRLEMRCVDTSHRAHGQTFQLQWRTKA